MKVFFLISMMFLCAIAPAQIDSCKCGGIHYTDSQDATCLECLVNHGKYLDKISKLEFQKSEFVQYIQDQKIEIDQLRDDNLKLNDLYLKAEHRKRIWKSIAMGAISIIGIETVVILLK